MEQGRSGAAQQVLPAQAKGPASKSVHLMLPKMPTWGKVSENPSRVTLQVIAYLMRNSKEDQG